MSGDYDASLAAGLRWLYETEQPPGAILQHHGVSMTGPGNRTFRFAPSGANGRAVVIVDVADVRWKSEGGDQAPANPLRPGELAELAAWLTERGYEVADTWNGQPGSVTGSVALARPAHPTLLAALARYHAGCPDHPSKGVFCDCGWYATGNALQVQPDRTTHADPGGAL